MHLSHCIIHKFFRCTTNLLFEETEKVLRILKTKHFGNLLGAEIGIKQGAFSNFCYFELNVFMCRLSCFRLYQITEVIG